MRQITVISGKGGTGKTVITGSFAALAKSKVMADCDVDASNLHLLLHPKPKESHDFKGSKVASIDEDKCNQCGKCQEVCRFNAITPACPRKHSGAAGRQAGRNHQFLIDSFSCEGCGACVLVCPKEAITLQEELTGQWFIGDTKYGSMVYAKLGIAEENSGKLVTVVREKAQDVALKEKADYVIIDGPPGIGCPVIATLSGVDVALVVTEPTLSGIHDMERVIGVCKHFRVKPFICINKYDLNPKNSERIKGYACSNSVEVLGEIPFDEKVIEAVTQGVPIVEYTSSETSQLIEQMWKRLVDNLGA